MDIGKDIGMESTVRYVIGKLLRLNFVKRDIEILAVRLCRKLCVNETWMDCNMELVE